ncbi:DUF2059 domain-containing protein [Chitinimonas sp.]|uniref:DUF2059 domain-containing protein n=1 Tax=Chitinimonas sp. TaxID=1934313 RepID=UPI002F93E2AC
MQQLKRYALALLAACLLGSAQADEIPADKRQAIQELIEVMNLKALGPQMLAQISAQSGALMKQGAVAAIEQDKRLNPAQRQAALSKVEQELPELEKAFNDSLAKFDMGGLMQEVMYGTYSKYFETAEIQDITAFYRSSTGQKMLAKMPQIMQESMQISMARMGPVVNDMVQKTLERQSAQQQKKKK